MKIYTRTGDQGETGRLLGGRVSKADSQIEANGAVDELNCALGWALSVGVSDAAAAAVTRIQHELFALGAMLSGGADTLGPSAISRMESEIDQIDAELPPLTQFILPGGSQGASALHMARATCRLAERRVVAFLQAEDASLEPSEAAAQAVTYLNRLADLLFMLARHTCLDQGADEVVWAPPTD